MEQKTNVLIWVHDFPAISETFIRNHIVGLLDKGCSVHIYTKHKHPNQIDALKGFEAYDLYGKCISNHDLLKRNKAKRFLKTLGLLFSKLGSKKFFWLLKSLNFFRYGSKSLNLQNFYLLQFILKSKIDVVHAHYGFMGNDAVFLKEVGVPIRLFTTFHGVDIREGLQTKGIYKKLFAKADGIISISKYNTDSLLQMGANENTLVSLPNGIDTDFFPMKPSGERDGIHILSVGRFMNVKGYDLAIIAFKRVCERFDKETITLHLIGDGPFRNSLTEMVKELGLEDQVIFHGWQTSEAIKEHYQNADFYVLPSRGEALPTVLLEAQSCGLPIVATDVGSVREMLPEKNIVVPSESVDALAQGMLDMLQRKDEWQEMGTMNRNHVVAHYDASSILEKLVSLYHRPSKKSKHKRGSSITENPVINILTRTSNRPNGFKICRESIENQTYTNIRHIVSYDDSVDLEYLREYANIDLVKVQPITDPPQNAGERGKFKFAPYNLYCNELMEYVREGWIIFLDDDDRFIDEHAVQHIVNQINEASKNTLLLWQMRYPDGALIPSNDLMDAEQIKLANIGAPCFTFHSKHKDKARWDCWKAGDFFFLKQLFQKIKKKKWIKEPYIQLNNTGNFGQREDISIE
ncbi:glycosyltransferase [Aureisphaera galaxeae]|uniref:glycosyltransferase n=1 Tax=Aureisphaera galaxeae TaxID=1538023 RepID=UPI00234FF0BB|nr:glycosyltransferase [Aureisphaera galaxeae]MDC8006284.1 glycosyltransferase [Aureisphaera galaxeae]